MTSAGTHWCRPPTHTRSNTHTHTHTHTHTSAPCAPCAPAHSTTFLRGRTEQPVGEAVHSSRTTATRADRPARLCKRSLAASSAMCRWERAAQGGSAEAKCADKTDSRCTAQSALLAHSRAFLPGVRHRVPDESGRPHSTQRVRLRAAVSKCLSKAACRYRLGLAHALGVTQGKTVDLTQAHRW
jgi:hypothetical protein